MLPLLTSRSSSITYQAAAIRRTSRRRNGSTSSHGKFDMGWEKLRDQIFANQKRLGVIPPETQLSPWPDGQDAYGGAKLPRWDSL